MNSAQEMPCVKYAHTMYLQNFITSNLQTSLKDVDQFNFQQFARVKGIDFEKPSTITLEIKVLIVFHLMF